MRERITFVHPQGADVDPKSLKISKSELHGPLVQTVRENRLTIALNELPPDVASLLPRFQEINLRWASSLTYDTIEPFSSRISPGLHISYTLSSSGDVEAERKLCIALLGFGSFDCTSNESFATKSEGLSGNPPSTSLYEQLESVSLLTTWTAREFCLEEDRDCQSYLQGLSDATSFDISWNSVAQTVRIFSLSPLGPQHIQASSVSQRRTEVGILSKDAPPNQRPHEIGISGLLTVLGEKKQPSGTMFSFASRHRMSGSTFSSQFLEPTGLHPTLQLKLSSNKPPVTDEHCAPHAYFTLPKTIFADRYQFADRLFLASKNLTSSRYTSLPVDLEAPAYTTKTWGSNVLLELAAPSSNEPEAWTAEVPLHLRYLKPLRSGKVDTEIPYPVVFWACDSAASADFTNNPFDRTRLGYDGLFDENTVFWHVEPRPVSGDRITSPISVPVLKEHAASWVGFGTAATVALGFTWVLWKLVTVFMASGYGSNPKKGKKDDKKSK
ncbi:protease B nonderepressible form [Conoideocrella luteorostrata]|uniref:Protein PBN1 n=1 Tax=Conoideocrella luteorostrata TaxID=1105319 RepID=A0AAJ0FQ09_9HYPO|nr:protease B nonderepressible form [Conoideocrella luteorostrata]